MNKKFSTFMTAGLLLSGALVCNVNAKTVTFTTDSIKNNKVLSCAEADTILVSTNVDLSNGKKYFVITQPNVTVLGNNTAKLTGRIIVAAEGVTIKNLAIETKPVAEDANGYWTKTALTAFADALTVDSCTFTASNPAEGTIPNGIVLYPQTNGAAYSLEGNTFTDLNTTVGDPQTWYSSAIQVYKNTKVEADKENDPIKALIEAEENPLKAPAAYGTGSANPAVNGAEIVVANKFTGCAADLVIRNGNELDKSGYSVEYAHISKKAAVTRAALDGDMVAALVDAIQNSKEGTAIEVAGATAEEVAAIITGLDKTVTKTFVEKNVVISTAKDEKALVLGTVDNAPEGAINLAVKADGTTTAYVAEVPSENVGSGDYILMTTDGKALQAQTDGTAKKETYTAAEPELFIWNVQYDAATNTIRFYNAKTKKYLIGDAPGSALVALAATDKKINPVITFSANVAGGTAAALGTYAAPVNPLAAGVLRSIFGASFYAAIEFTTDDKDADKTLKNNPFDGNLAPVQWKTVLIGGNSVNSPVYTYDVESANGAATSFMLQKENGKLIVMQTTEMYATTTGTKKYAYRIVEVDAKTVATSLKKGETTYVPYFSFNAPYDYEIGSGDPISNITVTDGTTTYQLGSISLSDVNTLAAAEPLKDFLDAITVELSKYNRLDAKDLMTGEFYTVTNKNTKDKYSNNYGKVLGLNENGNAAFMKTSEVLVGYPETQWAVTSANGKTLTFTNRENPNGGTFNVTASALYKTENDNVYAFVSSTSSSLLGVRDTIEIKAVATAPSDGYKRFNADNLKDQLFYLGSYSAVRGTAYVTENHKENHQVGLEKEQANATSWRMVPLMFQKEDAWGEPIEGAITPDTICIVSKVGIIKDKAITTQDDTLKIVAYSFKNIENNEFIAYDGDRNRFTTGNEKDKAGYTAYGAHFALKIMGSDSTKYNLVVAPVNSSLEEGEEGYYINNDNKPYTSATFYSKVYAGETSAKGILNQYNMYQQNESDLFTVAEKDAPEYLKLKQGDVIKIYREEYDSESNVLFEKGEFLGMGNAVENTKINPALYVDTVYVDRQGNNRWEYLLGLNITRIDTTYKCDEPAHANLIHKADTTKGRFLVNFADSAIVENGKTDIHVNKYIYETSGYAYAKLGFVNGFRTADTLHINNGNTKKVEKIEVGTSAPQLAKFAFRVVDPSAESFVVETGFKYPADYSNNEISRGYLRYINGYVVVTPDIKDAEIFKLKEDSRQPVANEDLNASSVSIVAGNGTITITGAAGKTVAISNILGQTIANTVLSSDNATIAAPAGVVVVAVEGEAAVKAIVK